MFFPLSALSSWPGSVALALQRLIAPAPSSSVAEIKAAAERVLTEIQSNPVLLQKINPQTLKQLQQDLKAASSRNELLTLIKTLEVIKIKTLKGKLVTFKQWLDERSYKTLIGTNQPLSISTITINATLSQQAELLLVALHSQLMRAAPGWQKTYILTTSPASFAKWQQTVGSPKELQDNKENNLPDFAGRGVTVNGTILKNANSTLEGLLTANQFDVATAKKLSAFMLAHGGQDLTVFLTEEFHDSLQLNKGEINPSLASDYAINWVIKPNEVYAEVILKVRTLITEAGKVYIRGDNDQLQQTDFVTAKNLEDAGKLTDLVNYRAKITPKVVSGNVVPNLSKLTVASYVNEIEGSQTLDKGLNVGESVSYGKKQ